jgi:hypothetical protein
MGNEPVVIVDSGSSFIDKEDREWMLREQIHAQQCEITALRKALMYTHPVKELTNDEIYEVWKKAMQEEAKIEYSIYATQLERQPFLYFARAILRKAQEK